MRRSGLLAATLVLPVLPMLLASPALAADNVICVAPPAGTVCNQTVGTIPLAITAANGDGLPTKILVGPGTYQDGPYFLNGTTQALTLAGYGPSTVLTLPTSASVQTYVQADHATVRDLTVKLAGEDFAAAGIDSNDTALSLGTSVADRVSVTGVGSVNATGVIASNSSQISGSSVVLPIISGAGSRGVYGLGGTTVTDTVITGRVGFFSSGLVPDNLSRLTITADYAGVTLDTGTVNIDDSQINLGDSTGSGLLAANFNPGSTTQTINANHLTITGGLSDSRGVNADAVVDTGKKTSIINLANSIVRGPGTSLVTRAGNDGSQGGPSTATINVSYSDYATTGVTNSANGTGGVIAGAGNVNVDPAFVNAAGGDYHLSPGSALVDKGNPTAGGPAVDRDGLSRVTDGDGSGTAVRDMGAYERPAVVVVPTPVPGDTAAPDTIITHKPAKKVRTKKVKISFSSTEAGATFTCKLDKGPYKPCASPTKVRVKVGKHTFSVRATDTAGNTDATPATFKFKRKP